MNRTVDGFGYLKKLAILVVEDDETTREIICEYIARYAGEVLCAVNGARGTELFHEHTPDIVITDIQMPELDGLSMVQEIKNTDRRVPVIVISAFDQADYLLRSIDLGVDKYLTKPINSDRMLETILECARRLQADETLAWFEAEESKQRHADILAKVSRAHLAAEMELVKSERQLLMALQCARMGYWEYDLAGKVFTLSDEFLRIYGLSSKQERGDVVSQHEFLERFIHPDDIRMVTAEVGGVEWTLECNFFRTLEFRILHTDGSVRYVSGWGRVQESSDGIPVGVFGLIQDVTEAKQAGIRQRQLEEDLNHSRKLEAVGRLAGGVAHDFNNKLTVIMGCAELARMDYPDIPHLHKLLADIIHAAQYSRDIAAQLLAFSRQQVVSPRSININEVIATCESYLGRLIGEDVRISFIPGAGLKPIMIDPVQIDQIIMNLAINSRDAMPDGGTFTVKTGIYENAYGTDSLLPPGEYVEIEVRDTGTGMDENILSRIFDPFFTTKEVGKGTGLGLATVYGIVTQNHGRITVNSSPGLGTLFTIYLPCHDEQGEESSCDDDADCSGSASILLVEDDESVLNILATIMERAGYAVTRCRTPQAAVELFENEARTFDLVITDVVMPHMSGRKLVERITATQKNIRVLYMSGYASEVFARRSSLPEGAEFIQKPVSARGLRIKLHTMLHSN